GRELVEGTREYGRLVGNGRSRGGGARDRLDRHFGLQLVEGVQIVRLAAEIDQRIDHRLADALDVVEIAVGLAVFAAPRRGHSGGAERRKRAQRLGEVARGCLADVADAQALDETVQWGPPA